MYEVFRFVYVCLCVCVGGLSKWGCVIEYVCVCVCVSVCLYVCLAVCDKLLGIT